MTETIANLLRRELIDTLAVYADRAREGLRAELARPIQLQEGRRLQFEVDPWSWGIHSCASEAVVLAGDWLSQALTWNWFERAEGAGLSPDTMIREELCPWFADCWHAVGGPARFSPAYLFHGYHDQQYDLAQRRWVSSSAAFRRDPPPATTS